MQLRELFDIMPRPGQITWIGIRPERQQPLVSVETVDIQMDKGLSGDHYRGGADSKRQVTLIQSEHLDVVARLLGKEAVTPASVRRNLVVKGINLLALHDRCFRIGAVVLEGTGYCHPCSRMEAELGPGGYNAMRGHGGITARVLEGGVIRVGDLVTL